MTTTEILDFRELERELANAVAADEKYRRENDAKFRAIHQKVASYEEFRDIVLASNLKPLERKDKIGGDRKQPWNPTATASGSSREAVCTVLQEPSSEPRNAFEFTREWRRIDKNKRYDFLLEIGAGKLSHIFHAEVCSALLGEMLQVLEENVRSIQWQEVTGILNSLAQAPRFDLNLIFLSKAEHRSCRELFGKLQLLAKEEKEAEVKDSAMLIHLMSVYKVSESNI
ncbi:dynein axonemal assembly factor 19 [Mantella aurantiaca]